MNNYITSGKIDTREYKDWSLLANCIIALKSIKRWTPEAEEKLRNYFKNHE